MPRLRRLASTLLAVALAVVVPSACGDRDVPAAAPAAPAATPSAPTATAPATRGDVISDQWYEVREDGRKNAWYHMVWTRSSRGGVPTIHDRTEHVAAEIRRMDGIEDEFSSRSVTDLERDEQGRLLEMTSETTIADRVERTTVVHGDGRYRWTQTVAGLTERREVATADPLPVDAEAFLAPMARAGTLREGLKLSFPAANYLASRLETVELTVEASETIGLPEGDVRCWRVLERTAGRPGETTWWIDANGVLAKLRSGTLEVRRTDAERACSLDPAAAAYDITFPASPEIPRVTSFDRCIVEATFEPRDGVPLPDVPETPFGREISRDGLTLRLELTSHDDPSADVALPVTDPSMAKWLERTNLYSQDHPRVREALDRAMRSAGCGEDAKGREVATALLAFVFRSLRKQSGPVPQPTAPEILEARTGDCSEHAVLFTALCRAAGLPARRLSGYAQVGDMWGAHAFCEVWLGKWVGADPTTNELGTRARYVAFGRDEDPDSFPGLVSQRFRGRATIRTVEFTDGGETVKVADVVSGTGLRDVLGGIALDVPPEGWTAEAGSPVGTADLDGPHASAQIRVIAGFGDLDARMLRETQFGAGRFVTFCGRSALRISGGMFARNATTWIVPWRRRIVQVSVRVDRGEDPDPVFEIVERLLAPTFR